MSRALSFVEEHPVAYVVSASVVNLCGHLLWMYLLIFSSTPVNWFTGLVGAFVLLMSVTFSAFIVLFALVMIWGWTTVKFIEVMISGLTGTPYKSPKRATRTYDVIDGTVEQ